MGSVIRKRYCKGVSDASTFEQEIQRASLELRHAELQRRRESPRTEKNKLGTNITAALGIADKLGTPGTTGSFAELIFWIAAALCVVAELAILRSAFFPHPSGDAPVPHSPRGSEMLWAVIPAIMLAVLLAATWRAVHY